MVEPSITLFLKMTAECFAILDAVLYVIHPQQWMAGLRVMDAIKSNRKYKTGKTMSPLGEWPTVFNGIHAICNRATVYHRDTNALPGWFDFLLTVGEYGRRAVLSFRNLGFCVPYGGGSLCAITSNAVQHGVPEIDGDRLCLAMVMEDKVQQHYHVM